jgi:hypothetical protein
MTLSEYSENTPKLGSGSGNAEPPAPSFTAHDGSAHMGGRRVA